MNDDWDERTEALLSNMSKDDVEHVWDVSHVSTAMQLAHRDHRHILHFLLWRYLRWLRRSR